MEALKPCPICGGEPEFQHFNITPNVRGRIICACGLEIMQGANDTEDDLRIIWNTRAGEGTRWHELFGTPERAARTLERSCHLMYRLKVDGFTSCVGCPVYDEDADVDDCCYDELLEWLRGDELCSTTQ